jgi:hypothetical protein
VTGRTLTEQALIAELEGGRARLLAGETGGVLLQALRTRLQTITTNIYVLRWIPEQGEDLFDVLVDGTRVAHVEVPRGQARESVFEVFDVEAYRRRTPFTKNDRRKLDLALQLARQS